MSPTREFAYLRGSGSSVVIDLAGGMLPRIVHWGADLGDLTDDDLRVAVGALQPLPQRGFLDHPAETTPVPEASRGWQGRPGLMAHRDGRAWSPRFEVDASDLTRPGRVGVRASDRRLGLDLRWEFEMLPGGLIRQRAAVANSGDAVLDVQGLATVLPVPREATEVLDLAGRWGRERAPQRREWGTGTHLRESWRGRTGADAATVLVAGVPGFGFERGQVWGGHVAWSGNHVHYAEALTTGERVIGGGELLLPGEIRLGEGDEYQGPWLYAGWADGLDALAARFHDYLRSRSQHPRRRRPVTMNVWEAVYFDHDAETLIRLAERAAAVGAERYVLDDGWFKGRRDDTAGLGDWYVDPDVWPGDSLLRLAERVRSLGMEFGLWVEPEMVNPDSDLFRAHPEWVLAPEGDGRWPRPGRNQQVLNLAIPEAWEYLRVRIVELVSTLGVDYLKWDHNRDLIEAGDTRSGRAGVHAQTAALYRLLDAIREDCPGLEIESCSSGGARVDLEILQRTDRVWASDCIDALERQEIQRWTAQLLPPELVGAHVGEGAAHVTGRRHDLSFRAITAMFAHLGIEWDLTRADDADLAELAAWIEIHKKLRPLLATGRTHRRQVAWLGGWLHGVVSPDRRRAAYAVSATERPSAAPAGALLLPGLDPELRYRVRPLGAAPRFDAWSPPTLPQWWRDGVILPGRVLGEAGLRLPGLQPETALLLQVDTLA